MTTPTNRPTPRPLARPPTSSPAPRSIGMSAFSRAQEEAKEKASSNRSYYSEEAKNRLMDDHTPIYLHAAARTKGQFGEKWELSITENHPDETNQFDGDGNPIYGTLSLSANAFRDELFNGLSEALNEGPVGPLQLGKRPTNKGNPSWDLTEWVPF